MGLQDSKASCRLGQLCDGELDRAGVVELAMGLQDSTASSRLGRLFNGVLGRAGVVEPKAAC